MSDDGVPEGSLSFCITVSDEPHIQHPFVLGPDSPPIKIGRYKKNDLCLTNSGVSWVHIEIRLLKGVGKDGGPGLGVKDCSSNGVGLKAPYAELPQRIDKGVDVEVPHGSVLVLPYKVSRKEKAVDSPQTTLTVEIDGAEVQKKGPVMTTWLAETPVGGLGAGLGALGGPKPNGSTRHASEDINVEDLRSDSEERAPQRSRSRSPRGQPPGQGGKLGAEADVVDLEGKESAADEAEAKKKKKKDKAKITPGATVRVSGLQARGELNGKVGTVIDFDQAGGFWKVRMEDGTGKAFKPANLKLAPQTDRLAKCRALLEGKAAQEDAQSDLKLLCQEMMDESKPPPPPDSGGPEDDEPPPPPPGAAPAVPEATTMPPPPPGDQASAAPASMPAGMMNPAMAMQPMAMGMQPMQMQMGMPQMPMGMPQMAMGMPPAMGFPMPGMGMQPPPPMGMPMPMLGFPPMGMGMQMPMGLAMPTGLPPPPAHPPPM